MGDCEVSHKYGTLTLYFPALPAPRSDRAKLNWVGESHCFLGHDLGNLCKQQIMHPLQTRQFILCYTTTWNTTILVSTLHVSLYMYNESPNRALVSTRDYTWLQNGSRDFLGTAEV